MIFFTIINVFIKNSNVETDTDNFAIFFHQLISAVLLIYQGKTYKLEPSTPVLIVTEYHKLFSSDSFVYGNLREVIIFISIAQNELKK